MIGIAGLLVDHRNESQISLDCQGQIPRKNRPGFAAILKGNFTKKTIGKKQPILWEFSGHNIILLESNWYCTDLRNIF